MNTVELLCNLDGTDFKNLIGIWKLLCDKSRIIRLQEQIFFFFDM